MDLPLLLSLDSKHQFAHPPSPCLVPSLITYTDTKEHYSVLRSSFSHSKVLVSCQVLTAMMKEITRVTVLWHQRLQGCC